MLIFTIPGPARGKGRARAFKRGNFIKHYTDDQTAAYENLVARAAADAHAGKAPFSCPLTVVIECIYLRPSSKPKKGSVQVPGRYDIDNLVKAVMDGLNQSGVWVDDKLVINLTATRRFGATACAHVWVYPAKDGEF